VLARVLAQAKVPLSAAAAINSTHRRLFEQLKALDLPLETGSGGLTKYNRAKCNLPKTHWCDAACVGASTPEHLDVQGVQALHIIATETSQRVSDGGPRASGGDTRHKTGHLPGQSGGAHVRTLQHHDESWDCARNPLSLLSAHRA
jgi:hypothetical protein